MHPSSIFHTDDAAARTIVQDNPMATLVANGADGPLVAIIPLIWVEDGTQLIGHIARSNPFWTKLQDQTVSVSAVFHAGNAYVSASAYPTKADNSRVVPTWNYVAAEVRGRLTFRTEPNQIRASVAALSDRMERGRPEPWSVDDAPPAYVDKLTQAIVAFEIQVTALRGVRKLSQNKSEMDRDGVVSDLMNQDVDAQRVAAAMIRETRA